jgi:hypothetical protein
MIALCAVIWVHVCIPHYYLHTADLWAMYTHPPTREQATVDRLGVSIDVYSTDNLRDFGTAGANRVCTDGRCVYYRKHCDAAGRVCEYEGGFSGAGATQATDDWSMKITAQSPSTLGRTVSALSLALSEDGQSGPFVPLSALAEESPSTDLFYCRPGVRMQGCLTPDQIRRARFGHE